VRIIKLSSLIIDFANIYEMSSNDECKFDAFSQSVMIFFFFLVNSVNFAPHEFGLLLACGSSDGSISIISSSGKT
jgi:hypothetical protein